MISIESGMLVALGFLMASLLALLLASAFWSRAVRLTTKRLTESLPVSDPEMKADLDRLRAAYAIKVHKLETQLEQARLERARQLIEINRRDGRISALETEMVAIKAELDENANARRVLEQTVSDRLPKVEARLAEARRLLSNRERELAELAQGARRQKAALEEATAINAQRSAEIERLNNALAASGRRRRSGASDDLPEGELALRAEVETLRTKTREQAALIDRLQRRLGEGYVLGGAEVPPMPAPGHGPAGRTAERLREGPADAEEELQAAHAGAPDAAAAERDRELRALKARAEDQASEITRLKAALATYQQADGGEAGLGTSRIALKARADAADALAARQTASIARLRAELASANERLARQAAHYKEEMRRIGSGTASASGQARRPGRDSEHRRPTERAADAPAHAPANVPGVAAPAAPRTLPEDGRWEGSEAASANGHGPEAAPRPPATEPPRIEASQAGAAETGGVGTQAPRPAADAEASAAASAPGAEEPAEPQSVAPPIAASAAAEMPQTGAIPEGRRKTRLLDRITGLGKA